MTEASASDEPTGPLVLERRIGDHLTTAYRQNDGSLLVQTGDYQFAIDRHRSTISVFSPPDKDFAPILAEGFAIAVLLTELGHPSIHANGVVLGDRAYIVAGVSGQGKSTTAALMIAAGASALADDLVRVHFDGPTIAVSPGSRGLRLRPAAHELANLLAAHGHALAHSADDRTIVLDERHTDTEPVELAAVVIPSPSRELNSVEIKRLTATSAVVALLRAARVTGWKEGPQATLHFDTATQLARRVPVLQARVPWGPPWRPEIAEALVAVLQALS